MTEADARIHLTVEEARELAESSLRGIGYDAEEAAIVGEHVLDAALCDGLVALAEGLTR